MTKRQPRDKKARSEGRALRISKRTLKNLTPTAQAGNAAKGGRGTFSNACGPGSGG